MLNLYKNIVTLGPIGYYKGSGTLASFCSITLIIFLHSLKFNNFSNIIIIFFLTYIALRLVSKVMPIFLYQDSPHIVIDEVLGMIYTFWGINLSLKIMLWGFFFFRFFDITKILGISYIERNLPNPLSIIMDDIFAGIFANCLLRFFL